MASKTGPRAAKKAARKIASKAITVLDDFDMEEIPEEDEEVRDIPTIASPKPLPPPVVDEAAIKAGMVILAGDVSRYIADNPNTFELTEPFQITVKKKDGSYGKRPQIGGEEFKIIQAYAGKRGSMIFVFSPMSPADFLEMEMSEKDANRLLGGFFEYMKDAVEGGFATALREVKKEAAEVSEKQKNVGKYEQYADIGFGSF